MRPLKATLLLIYGLVGLTGFGTAFSQFWRFRTELRTELRNVDRPKKIAAAAPEVIPLEPDAPPAVPAEPAVPDTAAPVPAAGPQNP